MTNLNYEEIMNYLRRVVEGDAYNDPKSLYGTLSWLASEVAFLIPKEDNGKKHIKRNTIKLGKENN